MPTRTSIRSALLTASVALLSAAVPAVEWTDFPQLRQALRPVPPPKVRPYVSDDCSTNVRGRATGFFHVEEIGGRWWAIDPLGRGFVFRGVQSANCRGVHSLRTGRARYREWNDAHGGLAAWTDRTERRLREMGFNTLGSGGEPALEARGFVSLRNVFVSDALCAADMPAEYRLSTYRNRPCSALPDMFHPDFPSWCDALARCKVAPRKDDPWLGGWFIDNELRWWCDGDNETGLFDAVAQLPDTRPARRAQLAFLAGRPVTRALKAEFLRLAADTYFRIATEAIRRADPNHMVLGCRFAGVGGAAAEVWEAAGRYCDAVTFNCYPCYLPERNELRMRAGRPESMAAAVARVRSYAGRPLLVTEWSFRAMDTGHPNSAGAGQVFETQAERAQAAEAFLQELFSLPAVVGHTFFRWVDQPSEGISEDNPEDGNYGLVNERDELYPIADVFRRRQVGTDALRSSEPLKVRDGVAGRAWVEVAGMRRDETAARRFAELTDVGRDEEVPAVLRRSPKAVRLTRLIGDAGAIQLHDRGVVTVYDWEPEQGDLATAKNLGVKYLRTSRPSEAVALLRELAMKERRPLKCFDFRIRDPFVLADSRSRRYYLYETANPYEGAPFARGVSVRVSDDLVHWSRPTRVMSVPMEERCRTVWAPEVYFHRGAYWMFATLSTYAVPGDRLLVDATASDFARREVHCPGRRGVAVFRSDSPTGPFVRVGTPTPADWLTLDGTLFVESGRPQMVFCHEWVQTGVGRVLVTELSEDLSRFVGEPKLLFRAQPQEVGLPCGPVTDGCFLYRSKTGVLFMIWSDRVAGKGYSVILCRSESGGVGGPWTGHHVLYGENGGHAMLFRTFEGRLKMALHAPDIRGREHLKLLDVRDLGDDLMVTDPFR